MSVIKENYLKIILKEIHFPFDRSVVRKELDEHLEESIEFYLRPGVTLEAAERFATQDFGEPTEIGQQLNKVHKPIFGWMWIISKYGLIILSIFTVFNSTPRIFQAWDEAQESEPPADSTEKVLEELSYGFSQVVIDEILDQRIELKDGTLIIERMILLKENILIMLVQQVDYFDPFGFKKTEYPLQRQGYLQVNGVKYLFELEDTSVYPGLTVLIAKDIPNDSEEISFNFEGYTERFTLVMMVDH